MDFWSENHQYREYNTLPSRSHAQNYDRQPRHYPVYCEENRGNTIDTGYYWPSREIPNWSNQETTAATSHAQFPFNLDHGVQHYPVEQHQELHGWASYQPQERGGQHEGWAYNPVHYKREVTKRNDNNFRELEAWALRYSHSLPRRRRIEAELRGGMQDNIERREMQMGSMQEFTLRDGASRQQALDHYQTSQNMDHKDKISYKTKFYYHPPNYNSPPPYNVQSRNVLTQQRLGKQSCELPQVLRKTEKQLFEKCPANVDPKGFDVLVGKGSSSEAARVIEGRKFQLNKKAGGLTIFCLVSRNADPEPENVQISQNEIVQPKASTRQKPLKLADEVDYKVPTSTKHARSPYSKLQAIPICKEALTKIAEKKLPKSNEVSAIGKLAAKFPLWRRPSFTSSLDTDNSVTTYSKEIMDSNSLDQENDSKTSSKTDTESETPSNKGDATLVDATCVVKVLLNDPKTEQVLYLSSEDQSKNEEKPADVAGLCQQENPTTQDTGQADDFETLSKEATSLDFGEKTNPETLEERAKRILGLQECKFTQDNFDLEDNAKQNDMHEFARDLVNMSSISESENLQPLQVTSCEVEVMDIGDVDEFKENNVNTEIEITNGKILANLEEESIVEMRNEQSKEMELGNSIDFSQKFELSEQGNDGGLLEAPSINSNLQLDMHQHLETIAPETPGSAVEESECENGRGTQSTVTEVNTVGEIRSEEEMTNTNVDVVRCPVKTDPENDISNSELVMLEEPIVQNTEIDNMEQLYSGQIEGSETGDNSESEPKQFVKCTETSNESKMAAFKQFPNELPDNKEDIEVVTSAFEIQEKSVELVCEINQNDTIVDATFDKEIQEKQEEKEQVDFLVTSKENVGFEQDSENDLKEQSDCRDGVCANDEGSKANNDIEEIKNLSEEDIHVLTNLTHVEIISENVENIPEDEDGENDVVKEGLNNQTDVVLSVDVNKTNSTLSNLEKEVRVNYNADLGQEKSDICAEEKIISNVEDDHLEITQEVGAMTEIDAFNLQEEDERKEEICAKLLSETAAILDDNEDQVSKPESQQECIVDQNSKIETPECGYDFDMQPSECEETTDDSIDVAHAQSAHDICPETKSKDVLQPQVPAHDQDVKDLDCQSNSIENFSSIDISGESHPSISTCENHEEGKCPQSLWDAVNRIRKHTAPDSENEEEELTDSWDRESLVSVENVVI